MADPGTEAFGEMDVPGGRLTADKQRYVAIVESVADCIIVVDRDGRITDFNAFSERTFGVRRADVLGKRLVDVILPPSRHAADADGFLRLLASERALVLGKSTELIAVCADGREITVELAITRATLGGRASFIISAHDVTDRKRTERELRRRAAAYAMDAALRDDVSSILATGASTRELLQGAAEAVVRRLDAAFARIWTLRRGAETLELRASAGAYTRLDGRYGRIPVGRFKIGRIARDRMPCLTNDVLTDPRIDDTAWARREGIVAFAGYPLVVDERVVGVLAMFARHALEADTLQTLQSISDVLAQGVERRRAEEELRRSEAYLAEGQRLSQTGSWAWNLDTGEMFFSAEMFRIYGFEPADHPPSYEAMLGRAHPDDAPNVDAAVTEALRTGTELRLLTRICIPGEPVKWVEAYGHPVREDGRVVEFIGTVIDVTERVRANRRGRRAIETRYEAVIAERTRIARDMHDGLLQDVAGIAMQLDAVLPHIRDEAVAARVRHILALTERTGRDARLAVVDMREQSDSVDLAAAVQDEARRTIAPAGLPFTVRVTGPVRLVSTRVCEAAVSVMHEAVTNALKHAAAQWITVSVVFRRRTVRLSLRDDGRGLTPAPNDGDSAGRIGLIGMRERAATVGATLRVSSIPGRGTTVRLDVPLGR